MNDSTDIPVTEPVPENPVFGESVALDAPGRGEDVLVDDTPNRGPGWLPVLLLSGMAAGAGALGGYALADADPFGGLGPDDRMAGMQSDLADLQRADGALRAQLTELERAPRPDARLERLEDRLGALESRPASADGLDPDVVDQLRTRLDTLEDARAGTDAPSATGTAATSRRLRELERRLEVVETALSNEPTAPSAVPLPTPSVSYSVDRPPSTSPVTSASAPTRAGPTPAVSQPLPAFPFADVEAAIDTPSGNGFLRRLVRVRDAEADAALADLRAALSEDDTPAALRAFDRLPDRAKDAASQWVAAARKNVESR